MPPKDATEGNTRVSGEHPEVPRNPTVRLSPRLFRGKASGGIRTADAWSITVTVEAKQTCSQKWVRQFEPYGLRCGTLSVENPLEINLSSGVAVAFSGVARHCASMEN